MKMEIEKINSLIKEFEISDLVEYIQSLSREEKQKATLYLLNQLKITQDHNDRNMLAIALSDLECQEAVETLMQLIFKPGLEKHSGSLVYALGDLECTRYYKELLPLLFKGNFQVRMNMYGVMEAIFPKLTQEEQQWCIDYIEKQMEEYEAMLQQVYAVYEDVMGGKLETEEED